MEFLSTVGAVGAVGVAGLAYSAGYEVRAFALREIVVPETFQLGDSSLKILHISDLHLMPYQQKKQRWLSGLADLQPDLIVATGDFIASAKSIEPLREVLSKFGSTPAVYVFGSNDYFGPKLKNPMRYLFKDKGVRIHDDPLPTDDLRSMLNGLGWQELTHRRLQLSIRGVEIEFRGVDDPHLNLDDYSTVAGAGSARLNIGVTHAPYLRVLDAMAADGMQMIFAGHTHGGQLCLPGYGTIITNCDLDRQRARGLSKHGNSWLHVSAGLGTNPFTPVRFACRPEATLLNIN